MQLEGYLDWRLYARTDRYYIKRFEDETNLSCHLLVDVSRSMGYGRGSYTKADYATTLAATLAYYLAQQRDAVGLVRFHERVSEYLPPRYRPGHLRRLMLALEQPVTGIATDVDAPLRRIAELVHKRGLLVLISDLLVPIATLRTSLGWLASRGHDLVLFQVLDRAELTFDFEQSALFHDAESGRDLYVDPEAARAEYLDRFDRHNQAVRTICDEVGVEYHQAVTDQPLERMLFDFLSGRMRRSRLGKRSRGVRTRRPA